MAANSNALPGWFRRRYPRPDDESGGQASGDETAHGAGATPSAEPGAESSAGTNTGASTTTGGNIDQEPVVVWEAANRLEAEIVAGRLHSENIPAIIRGEALGAIYGLTTGGLAATVVLVPAPLAAKALEILNSDVDWDESTDADFGTESL
ncbi:MAG: DUF2007 domain-containing protein [Caldilineaceae bacterium]|nr:DUF2007 domain-containing protein [Caldilineaceae bacterium]